MKLSELIKLNNEKESLLQENPLFNQNLINILNYVDDVMFENDIISKNICESLNEQSFQINLNFFKTKDVYLTPNQINNYLSNIKKALGRIVFKNKDFFNFYIFKEIFEIVKYIYRKTKWSDKILDFNKRYKLSSKEYHEQNETFKYMFSVFDKFAYIADHLNRKYYSKKNDESQKEMLKFYQNFAKSISFLTKDNKAFEKLNEKINMISSSSGWHLIRKLRNYIEHDFIDPLAEHNIALAIDLLLIYVLRIFLLLKETLLNEKDIIKTLNKLKEKE